MTLLNLALKNVLNNMRNYLLYFLSTITCIVIFFIFVSLKYAPSTMIKSEASVKIASAMSSITLVILVFVAVFILMTNNFFVRSRKKEIGVYVFSGMKQAHVAALLFIENTLIGLFSILLGLGLGMLLSRLATMLLVRMMGLEAYIGFYFPPRAFVDTVLAFGGIFTLTSVSSALMVYRFKVIELFNATRSEERPPSHSKAKAVAGLVLMLSGYGVSQLIPYLLPLILFTMITTLVLTISGTYLFFSAFTLYGLNWLKGRPQHIYKGVNILSTNHLMFRIQQNARAMATIAVLSASTISTLGTMLTVIEDMEAIRMAYVPHSLQAVSSPETAGKRDQLLDQILMEEKFQVTYDQSLSLLLFDGEVSKGAAHRPEAYFNQIRYGILSESKVKTLAESAGKSRLFDLPSLNANEAVFLASPYNKAYVDQFAPDETLSVTLSNGTALQVVSHMENQLIPSNLYKHFVVVSDQTYAALSADKPESLNLRLAGLSEPQRSAVINDRWEKLPESDAKAADLMTYGRLRELLNADKGINLFITIFVCLIFVMASGSVIYFKQLTDAVGEVSKYQTLFKLGVSEKDVKKTVSQQLRFMFGAPYVLAVSHSAFALWSLSKLLNAQLWTIGLISCSAYLLLYIGFYLGTKKSYLTIIRHVTL